MFVSAWMSEYNMEQNVSVDESLVLYKGKHSNIRYIPSKADKWGFKFYSLCESSSGYTYNSIIDQGAFTKVLPITQFPDLQVPGQYVMKLMLPILNRGHLLGVDNFYTDVVLFLHLLDNGTDAIGTLRKGRRCIPSKIMNKDWSLKDEKGKIRSRYGPTMYCFNWCDKKNVRIVMQIFDLTW
jgi:hypothetical protein